MTSAVQDPDGKPLPFVTLLLVEAADSVQVSGPNRFVKGAVSNEAGTYAFEQILPGTYRVAASRVGYRNVYSAPFTPRSQGNPYLKPQYTDAFQLACSYKEETTLSLGYTLTHDVIVDSNEQNDQTGVTRTTYTNLASETNISLNLSAPLRFTRW